MKNFRGISTCNVISRHHLGSLIRVYLNLSGNARVILNELQYAPFCGTCCDQFWLDTLLIWLIKMPIYEYRCESCGKELEKIQKFSDPPLINCPECNKPSLKKLVSASSFRLKGTGWYETDFKTKKKPDVSDDNGDNKGSSKDKASEGASETKGSSSGDGEKEKSSTSTESSKKSNSGDKGNKADKGDKGDK